MGKADLHIHSTYSFDGSASVEAILEQAARSAQLDVIAITDHDNIFGAQKALKLAPLYGIHVIPGCEVSTADGHLIALFVHKPIPARLPLSTTIEHVREQGGICVIPHPMALAVHSVSESKIMEVLQIPDIRRTLVGMEAVNAGLLYRGTNKAAQALCQRVDLSPVGSSDSHINWTIGHGVTIFPGNTPVDLREALLQGNTHALNENRRRSLGFYVSSVFRRMLRMMGWVTWTPSPNASLRLRPLAQIQE